MIENSSKVKVRKIYSTRSESKSYSLAEECLEQQVLWLETGCTLRDVGMLLLFSLQ
jgi:hypothetical protein